MGGTCMTRSKTIWSLLGWMATRSDSSMKPKLMKPETRCLMPVEKARGRVVGFHSKDGHRNQCATTRGGVAPRGLSLASGRFGTARRPYYPSRQPERAGGTLRLFNRQHL